MVDKPTCDRRRSQNRKAQRNHRNNVKNKIKSLEETNSRLLDLVLKIRKSELGSELAGILQPPDQAREGTDRYNEDVFEGRTMATSSEVRDSAQMLEAINGLSRTAGQGEQLCLNLRQSTASPPQLPTEMQAHTADISKDFPPMSPLSLESPWTLFGDGGDRNVLSPELETSTRRHSHFRQDTSHPMSTELMAMDMFLRDDDWLGSQQQPQKSGNEEFSGRTRPKKSAVSNGSRGPPLFLAVANSHLEVAEFLIVHGADPDSRDEHGRTPLHVCAECGDAAMTGLLLGHGASMEMQDKNGMTPLQLAASRGALGVVERLVRHGARVNL